MVKAMGNLLRISLRQPPHFRQRIVIKTKRLTLNYLQSYLEQLENYFDVIVRWFSTIWTDKVLNLMPFNFYFIYINNNQLGL